MEMFNMGIPRVKVVNPNYDYRGTECYIDGNKVKGVKSVDFRVAVDEVPQFFLETIGLPEIDMPGTVQFSFSPETVQQAAAVLKHSGDSCQTMWKRAQMLLLWLMYRVL